MKIIKKFELYKNRKYVSKLAKNTITKTALTEAVYWNDETKVIKSYTETSTIQNSVKDNVEQVSKKASLIGSWVGMVCSYVAGIAATVGLGILCHWLGG